jgi:short-subunit dehydrogenase
MRKGYDFCEKVVLVTGATGGIGQAVSLALVRSGATLVVSGRSQNRLEQIQDSLSTEGPKPIAISADLTQEGSSDQLISRILESCGRLDGLVSNAGGGPFTYFRRMGEAEFSDGLRLNLTSHIELTRAALPALIESGHGRIVFIGSIVAREPAPPRGTVYVTAKAGLLHFAESLFAEIRDSAVSVTSILPDLTDTEIVPEEFQYDRETLIRPGSIAEAVLYCMSATPDVCVSEVHLKPQPSLRCMGQTSDPMGRIQKF